MSNKEKSYRESSENAVENHKDIDEVGAQSAGAQSDVALLREQLIAKEEEAKNNYDRFIRQAAELENFKKRASRDKEDAVRFAKEALVKELLPVVDNLERAILHAKDSDNGESLVEGVEMVLKGLFDALGKHGVVRISAIGQQFDPQLHEAMAQVERPGHESNTVVDEHQKGYLLNDRLLRPALVTVVKTLKSNGKKNEDSPVEKNPPDD
jgi:molecular chaperone GrpE